MTLISSGNQTQQNEKPGLDNVDPYSAVSLGGLVAYDAPGTELLNTYAEANSLFEIDMELEGLLEEIQEQVESEGQAYEDLVVRF